MDQKTITSNINHAAEILGEAEALFITAGAGIGVDSGLPDFRGNEGFWKAYPPIARLGKSFSEMANPHWFEHNPRIAWAFYGHRLNLYRRIEPHPGFQQLLDLAEQKPGGYFVFTSNVDGQFQKAGYAGDQMVECHGSIHHLQCVQPCSEDIWDTSETVVEVDEEIFEAQEPLPHCRNCRQMARPNILMFGDWSWISDRSHRQGLRLQAWLRRVAEQQQQLAVVEIGAGQAVPTVRYQSERTAGQYRGTLIRINPRDYSVPAGHIAIPLGGAEGIRRLVEQP